VIKSASAQKNTKNFWWPIIPKTTAFNNPAKPLMTGKRIDLAGIQSFRLGRHEKIGSGAIFREKADYASFNFSLCGKHCFPYL
jgi:hypothetical protein